MPMTSFIDIDSLLQPISDETPTGADCREDGSPVSNYQQIKGARNAARASERSNLFGDTNDEADAQWQIVLDLAPKLIKEESKDLEVACWLAEAALRHHGIAGLANVFALIQGLVDHFWDGLYPMPDEDGIETRVAPLSGLNGEGADGVLATPIRNIKISEGSSVGPFTFYEYSQAAEIQRIQDDEARESKASKLGYTVDAVEKSVDETNLSFYESLLEALAEAIRIYKEIGMKLDELCGAYDAPPTRAIITLLEECQTSVQHLSKDKFPDEVAAEDSGAEQSESPGENVKVTAKAVGPVANRDQAFKQLKEIATFFKKTEPHSPISYLLQKAVKWGNMSLDQLVRELIPNEDALEHYGLLTGVETRNPDEDEDSY